MSTVNVINNKLDQTVRIFDQFYLFDVAVPANEYDIVNSFFMSVFKTKEAAENFTTTLFRIAQNNSIPVLTLLNQLEGQDQINLNATMCYLLNSNRSPSTLLGVNSVLTPNLFTARNVLP